MVSNKDEGHGTVGGRLGSWTLDLSICCNPYVKLARRIILNSLILTRFHHLNRFLKI